MKPIASHNPKQIFSKAMCMLLAVLLIVLQLVSLPVGFAADAAAMSIAYPKGTAGENSADLAEDDRTVYSIDYDPNGGAIEYGVVSKVGACAENDTNNVVYRGDRFRLFPSYYESLKNESGDLMFPGSTEAGYDYAPMLEYAINQEANNSASGKESYEIRIEEGVYYFGSTMKVWGQFSLNGIYGKTVFVCESDDTALFKAGTNQTYYQGCNITDITFVAKGAHPVFDEKSSAADIMAQTLNPKIVPVIGYNWLQNMNISWVNIYNCTVSGFDSPLAGVKGHMCTRIHGNTFGPCRVAFNGTHFIDCFIYDNYFCGGVIENNGVMDLPQFTTGMGANLTNIDNNYIKNFFYGSDGSDSYGVAHSNNTYDTVYGIKFHSGGAISRCLFKNNSYSDIAAFFESLGYTPYTGTAGTDVYAIHTVSYTQFGKTLNKMYDYNRSCVIECDGGTALTHCKFEEENLADTELFRFGYFSNATRKTALTNTQILDNAYDIDSYQKENIFRDNINLKNNSMRAEWDTKYHLARKSSKEACVYYDPDGCIKIDLSCFFNPDNNVTLGVESLGTVGADEKLLHETVGMQYSSDIAAGRKVVYLSDFGATADDRSSDSQSIQKAFDAIAETGDILIIKGTYNITTPILLRGGCTYRVVGIGGKSTQNNELVGGGFSLNVENENLSSTGAFVQDKDDTGKISGYFQNLNIYPNNVGRVSAADRSGTVFHQVRFDKMLFKNCRFSTMETAFEKCSFNDSVINGGYSQYNTFGIMKGSVFENSVICNAYATGSICDYGIGHTYAYFLTDTDFINSTMRGCWIEFMQLTNGFRLSGKGNSAYVGNVFDYVWNFQFGENDIFAGNALTHCDTVDITNHLTGPDNVPRETWTPEIREGNITLMHVSDGLRLIGNNFCAGNTLYTTYFNFDGRTSIYKDGDRTVTSISNARIAGNITGNAAGAKEQVQFLCSDTLLKENCVNNNFDLTSMAKSKKYIPASQVYAYNENNWKDSAVPGTLVWL